MTNQEYDNNVTYLTVMHEVGGQIAAGVAGGVVGAMAGRKIRRNVLTKKCHQQYAKNPAQLKQCLAKAQKLRTASDKGYGFS